jgi:lambda family phage portal protein
MATRTLRGGVEMDAFGAPVAYHVRNAHQSDFWAYGDTFTWTRVPRQTAWGRPVFIHGFEPDRAGQTRGMSPFASLVIGLRKLMKFSDSEISSAAANALFAAFVESDLPPEEVAQRLSPGSAGVSVTGRESYLDRVTSFYTANPPKMGGSRIPVMLPGSKITMNSAPRQTTAYPAFERAFLNRFASRLGLSGEQLSMDFSQTNYSSVRAALNESWRSVRRMMAVFAEQVCAPIYYAVIEEAFAKAYLSAPAGAPAFHDMPGAYLRARWIGPGRGFVDPVKEAEASGLKIAGHLSTLESESAEQGRDYEDDLDQLAREASDRKKRGLPDPVYGQPKPDLVQEGQTPGASPASPAKGAK